MILLSSIMALSFVNPVSAEESGEEKNTYTYEYNGLEFTGDTKLSQEQLELMYNDVMNASELNASKDGSSADLFAEVPGDGQVRVIAPYYRTYTTSIARSTAELTTAYLISRTPKKIRDTTFGAWVFGKIQGWARPAPTYVGSWATSSWSNYQNKRVYHATLVHFRNSNYTSPTSIQYWDISHQYY